MNFKQLLSFKDVADELGCDQETVRSIVVEEQSLPAVLIAQNGSKAAYAVSRVDAVGSDGSAFRSLDSISDHIGYVRVQRLDLDAYKAKHPTPHDSAAGPMSEGWPDHTTKKLTALRSAAVKFWSRYDPAEPDTGPTNEKVIAWLMKEHGIKRVPASEMASILRPETLRTGRR